MNSPLQSQHLRLAYLAAEQAQKHVTVNESLRMLDALVQASVRAGNVTAPPANPDEGARYLLGAEPQGVWAEHGGKLAAWQDGAWAFFAPQPGWRVWDEQAAALMIYDGAHWRALASASPVWRMVESEHGFDAGASQALVPGAPAGALIVGASLRVLEALAGPASWSLGVAGDSARYGQRLALAQNTIHQAAALHLYAAATPLLASAQGGAFHAQGRVRLRLYLLDLTPPGGG